MTIKTAVTRQYQTIVDQAATLLGGHELSLPPEGWIATVRKALGMSGTQLAKRLGVTRARVSKMERDETDGGVTLRSMQAAAAAMNCRFVYAIVPEGRTGDVVAARAREKAEAVVQRARGHMALESQALSARKNEEEVERLARELACILPSDLWTDK